MQNANAAGLQFVTSGTPAKGDVIVYYNNKNGYNHVVIADGQGGYYGNSSSQNQGVHGSDYHEMGWTNYAGFISLQGK